MKNYIDPEYSNFNYYSYYFKHPLAFLTSPIGWLLGHLIVVEQSYNLKQPRIISRNGFSANYLIYKNYSEALNISDEQLDNSQRKIRVYFGGNAMNIANKRAKDLSTKRNNADIATIHHPSNATFAQAEIECGETLIKKLIKEDGYDPKNITIEGISLGGGISAQVIDRFKYNGVLKPDQKFEAYINQNSFSYLSNVVTFFLFNPYIQLTFRDPKNPNIANHLDIWLINTLVSTFLSIVGWELNTMNLLTSSNLPVNKVIISAPSYDEMLGNMSKIKPDRFNGNSLFEFHSHTGKHNDIHPY
jgi:hypothetical protein